jgi:transcriptional regulator with XRE-family HTH domain
MVNELAELLIELRVKNGLTQRQVATRLGYTSAQFVSNWERGLSAPPTKKLGEIAEIYKTSSDGLFKIILKQALHERETSMRNEWANLAKKRWRK